MAVATVQKLSSQIHRLPSLSLHSQYLMSRSSATSSSAKVADRIIKLFAMDPAGQKREIVGPLGQTLLKALTNQGLIDPASHRLEEIDACFTECEVNIAQEWLENEASSDNEADLKSLIGSDRTQNKRHLPLIWSEIMRFFINPHKPTILALSRPDNKKNVTTLLKAFGECQPLRELANLMILKRCLLKGVFINPALVEPFSLALIEYYAIMLFLFCHAASISCITAALSTSPLPLQVKEMLLDEISAGFVEAERSSGVLFTLFQCSEQLMSPPIYFEALQVLLLLVKVYQKLPSPDYLSICQCLMFLDELEGVVSILEKLLRSENKDEALLAFQVAFDLVENEQQAFLLNVRDHLLVPNSQPSVSAQPVASDPAAAQNKNSIIAEDVQMTGSSSSTNVQEADPKEVTYAERLKKIRGILSGETSI